MDRPRRWPKAAAAAAALLVLALFASTMIRDGGAPSAFASSAVAYHEASRTGSAGPSVCLRSCCCTETESRVQDLARGKVDVDPCLHPLDTLGYAYRSASLQESGGRVLCWTQQQNASGQLVSHTLVSERLVPDPVKMWEVSGRALVLFTRPDGFT